MRGNEPGECRRIEVIVDLDRAAVAERDLDARPSSKARHPTNSGQVSQPVAQSPLSTRYDE